MGYDTIYFENTIKYEIEYNPMSKTWCLYRHNIRYKRWKEVPLFQDKDKQKVEEKLKEIISKKGRKKVNGRTKLK